MTTVTQKARYRQAIIQYADKHGVTKAANRYDVTKLIASISIAGRNAMTEHYNHSQTDPTDRITTQISTLWKNYN